MTHHDDRHEGTAEHGREGEGDGSLGPGTTAGGGAVRAGERVDDRTAAERERPVPEDRDE
jgi:hypothetical protein